MNARGPLQAQPGEPGWWQASDGMWYPPELAPGAPAPPAQQVTVTSSILPSPAAPDPAPPNVLIPTPTPSYAAAPTVQNTIIVQHGQSAPVQFKPTSTLLNVLWLVLAGWWLAIVYVIAGIFSCLTIIGVPFGVQAFKLAGYALWPFGRVVVYKPNRDVGLSTLGNVVWFIFGGWYLVLAHLFAGLLLCLTIVGIPLGIALFKMAGLAIAPFGKQIVSSSQLNQMPGVIIVSQVG